MVVENKVESGTFEIW